MFVVNYKKNFMSQSNEHSTSELFTNICDEIKGKHRVGKLFDHGDVFNMLERALGIASQLRCF